MAAITGGEASGVICWQLNRLARNPIDGGSIIWAIKEQGIKIVTPAQTYSREAENSILMYVEFGMAQKFIDDLSKNTKRGLLTKVQKGWLPGVAPTGYLNNRYKDKGEKDIYKDPERFPLVRKMWDLMLTGAYTVSQILEIASKEWGFRTRKTRKLGGKSISKSGLYRIFTNPFYYGWIDFNGKLYKGAHEPMVTEEEFDRVQKLLGRDGRPRPQKHKFPYTGLIKCGECGCFVTAEKHTKHYPQTKRLAHYTYYHCTKKKGPCSQPWITEDELERQISEYLSKIQISELFKDWAIKYLREMGEQEVGDRTTIYQNLQKAYNETQKQVDTLLDLRLRGSVSDQEYEEKKQALIKEQGQLKERLEDTENRAGEWLELSEKTFEFARSAKRWFENGSPEDRKIILAATGSNLLLKDGKLRIEAQKPLRVIERGVKESPDISERFELADLPLTTGKAASSAALNPTLVLRSLGEGGWLHVVEHVGTYFQENYTTAAPVFATALV